MIKKLTFIAEIGLNHNGNFDLCYELIKQAKWAGADIVKFQLGWRDKPNEINQFNKKRIQRTKMIDRKSKLNYFAFHLSNPLMNFARNLLMKYLVKNNRFINSYLGTIYKNWLLAINLCLKLSIGTLTPFTLQCQ